MRSLDIHPSMRGIIVDKLRTTIESGDDVVATLVTREDLTLCIRGLDRLMMTAINGDTLKKIESLRDDYLELIKVRFE